MILCGRLWKLIIISISIEIAFGFNLDWKFSTFYKAPQKKSFFGYSVDLFASNSQSWVVVGAPKANVNGEIYRCPYPLNDEQGCELIKFSKDHANTNVKEMLGATLVMGLDKQLLTCAPQYTNRVIDIGITYFDLIGTCYYITDFTRTKPLTYRYTPCYNTDSTYHYGRDYSYCQAGFSAAFSKDKTKLMLGAVGTYYGQGSIMLITNLAQNISSPPIHTDEFKPEIPASWKLKKEVYYQQTYDTNYMGYAVAMGTTGSNSLILATSAPRRLGFDFLGAVTVYDDSMVILADFKGEQIGEYFGHGLKIVDVNNDGLDDLIVGSPLYTDYSGSKKRADIGRIYVYYQMPVVGSSNPDPHLIFSTPQIINGNVTLGRFGSSISAIGDINDDGYQDILVSAPYVRKTSEQPSGDRYGALYLFNGAEEGLSLHPSQVVYGYDLEGTETFPAGQKIRGLGFSLSGNRDLDDNGYPDVVAGGYLGDQAVFIRARPVVRLVVDISISPNKVDLETFSCELPSKQKTACFFIKTCITFTGNSKLPASIDASYQYDVDSKKTADNKRVYLLNPGPKNVTLTAGATGCYDETAYMKSNIQDKLSDIAVTVDYWLREENKPMQPMLDQLARTSETTTAKIYKDCGADEICIPDLRIVADMKPAVVQVGRYTEVIMTAIVTNNGDNAYLTFLNVAYPHNTAFVGLDNPQSSGSLISCTEKDQFVRCQIGNPMKRDTKVEVNIKFGVHDLLGNVSKLEFNAFANCSNEHQNESNTVSKYVGIEVVANIDIYNVSTPSIISLDKITESEAQNKSGSRFVSHTYEITNTGPATITEAQIILFWPLRTAEGNALLRLSEVMVSDSDVKCHYQHIINASLASPDYVLVPSENSPEEKINNYNCLSVGSGCYQMDCNIQELTPKQDVVITIKASLMLAPLLQSPHDSIISSSLEFRALEFPYEINKGPGPIVRSEVNTVAAYSPVSETSEIQWWIIAVSVGAGVLFLIIIILLLWWCGFFKRKTRPQKEEDIAQTQALTQEEPDEMQQELEKHLQ